MNTPFTIEQFLDVFRNYNTSVFPMQFVFYLLCIIVIFLAVKNKSHKTINSILSFFWLWMGVVYHIIYFSPINKAAYAFGTLFIVQSILILYFGVFKNKLSLGFEKNIYGFTGILLMLYALIIYPYIGYLLGHSYPYSPTLGLPCPTTIFTLGVFLWSDKKFPLTVIIIPFVWSVIGFMAAMNFGIKEDIGLLIAGVLTLIMLILKNKKYTAAHLQQS
jgi:hypothetical protein